MGDLGDGPISVDLSSHWRVAAIKLADVGMEMLKERKVPRRNPMFLM